MNDVDKVTRNIAVGKVKAGFEGRDASTMKSSSSNHVLGGPYAIF
jgi:hypothetical protein